MRSSFERMSTEHPTPQYGTDAAGLSSLRRGLFRRPHRFFVAEGAGRAGLHALAAEGALGVLQVASELGGDLGCEAAARGR